MDPESPESDEAAAAPTATAPTRSHVFLASYAPLVVHPDRANASSSSFFIWALYTMSKGNNREWRSWYGRPWRRLRDAHLAKAPLCAFCEAIGRVTAATVADHKVPHKGDKTLFLDPNNLQSLCKPCHDRHKQAQEKGGNVRGCDIDGVPVDGGHHWA